MEPVVETLSRFKVLNSNQMIAPGKCSGCGKFSNDAFIDMGLELEFYGVVYMCGSCFSEAALLIGYVPADTAQKVAIECAALHGQLMESIGREQALRGVMASLGIVIPDPGSFSLPTVEADEHTGHPNDEPLEVESGSDESTSKPGSPGVFHDDSIESLLGGTELDI